MLVFIYIFRKNRKKEKLMWSYKKENRNYGKYGNV